MKAVVITAHGGPEVLEPRDLPSPEPGPGEVRVKVAAAALNHLDLWVRRGHPGLKLDFPFVPSADVAGVADLCGEGVTRCEPGDRVLLYPALYCNRCEECLEGRQNLCPEYSILGEKTPGGLAEELVIPERNVYPMPEDLDFEKAAAFPLATLTSWHMLADKVRLRPGDWVLIQAAASGTGVAALQIARLFGARVIATAGAGAKLKRLRELGAEETIDYREEDVRARVRKITAGRGCAVVVDHVGADTFRASLGSLAAGGSYVTCGGTSGPRLQFDVRHLFIKHQRIVGSTMGTAGDFQAALEQLRAGRVRPVIHRVFEMEQAAKAYAELEQRAVFGKVVIRVG